MTAKEFQKLLTRDRTDFLAHFLALLRQLKADYCVIGGLAVNAYAEPVVTLDCNVVVVVDRLAELESALRARYRVKRFAHSLNVTDPQSDLRVQIQTDDRYQEFLGRSRRRPVLGRSLPVAAVEDVLQGKVWAFLDETRRASERQKDLADIARLVEKHPALRARLPAEVNRKLV